MEESKKENKENEKGLHPRNIHSAGYDFDALIKANPELSSYIKQKYDTRGIDFSDADAILCLNKSLLLHHYNVKDWTIPQGNLCPPIPGRANYIHYIADLLAERTDGATPVGTKVKGLDIGTGTGCIYPILGNSIYGWKFIGSDISADAINSSNQILRSNPSLKKNIKVRFQKTDKFIFKDLIKPEEKFDFTMCNPPFFTSLEQAKAATEQKVKNLNINREKKGHSKIKKSKSSNFRGMQAELWCPGGEASFIAKMIKESQSFKDQCRWFTSLVSNKENLEGLYSLLEKLDLKSVRTIEMKQGKKISHILAWSYHS